MDLIFGCKQSGPAAVEAFNVFHPYFYEENVRIQPIAVVAVVVVVVAVVFVVTVSGCMHALILTCLNVYSLFVFCVSVCVCVECVCMCV